jgi:lysophospholipase L1-like esterase
MARRSRFLPPLVGVLVAVLLPITTMAAEPPPLPASIAAVGDSITQAASSGGSLGANYPANSWSTGTNASVNSHYARLIALDPTISGRAFNDSVSGAKVADLDGQMRIAAGRQPDYLTVLIGGNDLCTDTVAQMTSVADFTARFTTAMDTLAAGSPGTSVLVVSIPRVTQLWELFKGNFSARFVWSVGGICQSLLANPTSTQAADVQRRAQVAQRNIDFNGALAQVCAQYAQCRFDGNAVYNVAFSRSDVSADYFHPSIAGQAKLAVVTWAAGYWPNGGAGPIAVHLGSVSGATAARKGGWTATVTVTARDVAGNAVGGATVSGAWSSGTTGSCVTATTGSCSMGTNLGRKVTSVAWNVTGITAAGYAYAAAANEVNGITLTAP